MNNKEKYTNLCSEEDLPVFLQPWWLDVVCGRTNWDVVLVEKGGMIWGALPFYRLKTIFGIVLGMPPLTQFIGPWIRYPKGQKYTSKLSHEKEIMTGLIEKLPRNILFKQNFHHSITNWLPFYWKGFEQTTRYTYVIPKGVRKKEVWESFDKNTRSDIRKAEGNIKISESDSVKRFFEINKLTFERKNIEVPYSFEFFQKIHISVKINKSGTILLAKDKKEKVHAVCYLIWDAKEIFYLAGGINPDYKSSGAMSLLIWEAIQMAIDENKIFNFEGSMLESVERFFRSFGAQQKPYFRVSKVNSPLLKTKYFIEELL